MLRHFALVLKTSTCSDSFLDVNVFLMLRKLKLNALVTCVSVGPSRLMERIPDDNPVYL